MQDMEFEVMRARVVAKARDFDQLFLTFKWFSAMVSVKN